MIIKVALFASINNITCHTCTENDIKRHDEYASVVFYLHGSIYMWAIITKAILVQQAICVKVNSSEPVHTMVRRLVKNLFGFTCCIGKFHESLLDQYSNKNWDTADIRT